MDGTSSPTENRDLSSVNSHLHDHVGTINIASGSLLIILIATFVIMIIEIVVGYAINSLALIADGGHMLNDVFALFIAFVAIRIGQKEQSYQFTFGYRRVEVLSGLINGLSLILISAYIVIEGIGRVFADETPKIQGLAMLITAIIGLTVNIFGIKLLKGHSNESINVEGAYHHLIADFLGSIAAVTASLAIILFEAYWTDILVSLIISIMIFKSGFDISRKALRIILEASPHDKDVNLILSEIMETPGVLDVHDLHCWTLTSGTDLITGHITIEQTQNSHEVLANVVEIAKNHGYDHPTFQIELDSCVEVGECYPFKRNHKN